MPSDSRPPLTSASLVSASPDQVSSDLAGETVLLDMRSAHYYGFQGTGARIWDLVQRPRRIGAICACIVEEFDVDVDRCERDVLRFLDELHAKGLLAVHEDA